MNRISKFGLRGERSKENFSGREKMNGQDNSWENKKGQEASPLKGKASCPAKKFKITSPHF
jgi:hypothetical protein